MALDAQVKRYFWLVRAAVVVACSAFAANAVAHVIAATAFAERTDPLRRPALARPAASSQVRPGADPSAAALVARNMFCSTCVVEEPAPSVASAATGPVATELPLRLVATNVSAVGASSFATIRNTSTGQQGAYRVGERIPGAGPLRSILGKYVEFDNQTARRLERISLLTARPSTPPARPRPVIEPPKRPKNERRAARDALLAAVKAGVRKLDDDSYEVDRAVVAKVLANPGAATRGARIVPSVKNGKPNGFKMYAVRPSSVYARIGFKSGDTIHAINGFELNTMDKALEVYTKVREASSLSVTLTRRGKPLTLDYSIK